MSRSWFRSSATVFSAILTALTILTIVPMQAAAATPPTAGSRRAP